MTKHTPGPWKTTTNGTYGPWVDSCDHSHPEYGAAAHHVGIERHSIATTHGNNKRANAGRIVSCVNALEGWKDPFAAPALLAAAKANADMLKEAAKQFRLLGDGGHSVMCKRHEQEARAAIRQAEGEGG